MTTTVDDACSSVTVQHAEGNGWCMTKFAINPDMLDIIEQPGIQAKQDTLFLAFALALPRSFDGCIWDAKQHAEQHAQAGILLDYEYMPYQQYLRRMTVQYICEHWGDFKALIAAEHGPGISSASTYRMLMLNKYSNTGLLPEVLALCDLYNCAVDVYDSDRNTVYNLFPRKVAASAASGVALLRKDGFYHVLLPSDAESVDLPGFMCIPPQILDAVFRDDPAMVYIRDAAMGVSGRVHMDDTDVLPRVCLAMPPRPLQGADLQASPQPWVGEPAVDMFSFAHGRFCGWNPSEIKQFELEECIGSMSLQGGKGDKSSSDSGPCGDLVETPVLTIPCPGGGEAVARFMAASYFVADMNCWQCGGLKRDLQHVPAFQQEERCSCTSCKCIGCCAGQRRGFTCA